MHLGGKVQTGSCGAMLEISDSGETTPNEGGWLTSVRPGHFEMKLFNNEAFIWVSGKWRLSFWCLTLATYFSLNLVLQT